MDNLPKFKDIIGLYAEDENDVSTPIAPDLRQCEINETCPICPHRHDCASHPYTEQQITDYCEKVEKLPGNNKMLDQGVQIIKQLQVGGMKNEG